MAFISPSAQLRKSVHSVYSEPSVSVLVTVDAGQRAMVSTRTFQSSPRLERSMGA